MNDPRPVYDFGRFRLDPQRRRVLLRADGAALALPPRVFDTLLCLIEHRGELVEKSKLMDLIWPHTSVEENSLNRNISLLRRVLGERPDDHRFIVTAPGQGYRFVAEVSVAHASSETSGSDVPSDSTPAASATDAPRSVAVLPFANLTGDQAKDYLCSGIAEELIHRLSRIEGLKIPARTSSFAYKDRDADVRLIARELGVKSVLEGSVRAAAGKLRITVKLVDGATGYHTWSQSFDRALNDLLALQDEIAVSVLAALPGARELRAESPSGPPTHTVSAYRRLMEAEWLLQSIPSERNVRRAIELMQQVVGEDPHCARAFATLAAAHAICHGMQYPIADALNESERYAQRALALDASEWDPYVALAEASRVRGHWEAAAKSYAAGISAGPNAPMAYGRRSMALWLNLGYLRLAFDDALQSHLLAPARPITALIVALATVAASRNEEAGWYIDLVSELGFPPTFGHLPLIGALLAIRSGQSTDSAASVHPADVALAGSTPAIAEKWELIRHALRGAMDEAYACARRLLDGARSVGEVGSEWWVIWLEEMRSFRRDERFHQLSVDLGLSDYWLRNGPPDGHELRNGRLVVP